MGAILVGGSTRVKQEQYALGARSACSLRKSYTQSGRSTVRKAHADSAIPRPFGKAWICAGGRPVDLRASGRAWTNP
jgi:hypothetical protein